MNKQTLRTALLDKRRALTNKALMDTAITERLIASAFFQHADTLLCYLSLPDEVSTDNIILAAWNAGKRVAVPVCRGEHMDFYCITAFDELHCGSFCVREPDTQCCERLSEYTGSICIVPGLAFQKNGFRLGYGKGYYDRFLKNYAFLSVGLCYNSLVLNGLPTEPHDIPVDMVITDEQIFGG